MLIEVALLQRFVLLLGNLSIRSPSAFFGSTVTGVGHLVSRKVTTTLPLTLQLILSPLSRSRSMASSPYLRSSSRISATIQRIP